MPIRRDQSMPFVWHVLLVVVLAAVVSMASLGSLWWLLGQPSMPHGAVLDNGGALDLVKLSLGVTAGMGGVVALVVAYRKQHLHESESRREYTKLCNERFGRAADQLGSGEAAVRLAGIYALAGLADDWPAGRQTCIDVLCACVRMSKAARRSSTDQPEKINLDQSVQEAQVRRTILNLIAARLQPDAPTPWIGHDFDFAETMFDGCDFTKASFTGGTISFKGATFTGKNVFAEALFADGRVLFNAASFASGGVYFGQARFAGAQVDFSDANFTGSVISFVGATFSAGRMGLGGSFSSGAIVFSLAEFSGTDVSFEGARFSGTTIDLSEPRTYRVPPRFDRLPSGHPLGLQLPPSS